MNQIPAKRSLLCAAVRGPSDDELLQQLRLAEASHADLIEWRLDLLSTLDISRIASLKQKCSLPSIFTLRPTRQGGSFAGTEEQRLHLLEQLANLHPSYIDLESDISPQFVAKIKIEHPDVSIILSHHNFECTPSDLSSLLKEMKHISADYYKIATHAQSVLDSLHLLAFIKQHPQQLIGMCMGEYGQLTRIVGPLFGNLITYSALSPSATTAPGQLTPQELHDLYRTHAHNSTTQLYGLIGDPIDKSISHLTHNFAMQQLNLNALYTKMCVRTHELKDFFSYACQMPFGGLSVTMPLKEAVMGHLDQIDSEAASIGAVNTICFKEGKTIGYNTDGIGALNALEAVKPVRDKTVLILGAGGAARAVVFEAIKRGAHVIIANRTLDKAKALAAEFRCHFCEITRLPAYDFAINATPAGMPIESTAIQPHTIAMDMTTRPPLTPFLTAAQERSCITVPGYKMFVGQAAAQFALWFGISPSIAYALIQRSAENTLALNSQ